jgi:hypothetical protein
MQKRAKSTQLTPKLRLDSASNVANLEPIFGDKGDRQKLISLRTLLTNKKRRETRDAAKLGDVLIPWFERAVAKPAAKLEGVAELWQEHVPANILRRCRLVGFNKGTLSVALDSATVRSELDAKLRGGLLRTLQRESKGALFRVKTSVEGQMPAC